jgi:hypothetical protein
VYLPPEAAPRPRRLGLAGGVSGKALLRSSATLNRKPTQRAAAM